LPSPLTYRRTHQGPLRLRWPHGRPVEGEGAGEVCQGTAVIPVGSLFNDDGVTFSRKLLPFAEHQSAGGAAPPLSPAAAASLTVAVKGHFVSLSGARN